MAHSNTGLTRKPVNSIISALNSSLENKTNKQYKRHKCLEQLNTKIAWNVECWNWKTFIYWHKENLDMKIPYLNFFTQYKKIII